MERDLVKRVFYSKISNTKLMFDPSIFLEQYPIITTTTYDIIKNGKRFSKKGISIPHRTNNNVTNY